MSLPRVQLQLLAPGPESVADQTMISSVLKIENEKSVIQSMQLGTCPMATPNNLRSLTIDSNKPFPFVFHNIVGTTHIWYGTYIGAWVAIFFCILLILVIWSLKYLAVVTSNTQGSWIWLVVQPSLMGQMRCACRQPVSKTVSREHSRRLLRNLGNVATLLDLAVRVAKPQRECSLLIV